MVMKGERQKFVQKMHDDVHFYGNNYKIITGGLAPDFQKMKFRTIFKVNLGEEVKRREGNNHFCNPFNPSK